MGVQVLYVITYNNIISKLSPEGIHVEIVKAK